MPFNGFKFLKIGEYEISEYPHGGFWIAHESGEGMQVSEKILAEWLHKFYETTF